MDDESYTSDKSYDNYVALDIMYGTQRSGKWTREEEHLAKSLIVKFNSGQLKDCENGCTLRSYLSSRLNCNPMRISKKLAGLRMGKVSL